MVDMVLSKFFTLTVFSVISITVPSAPYLGIEIQSSTRNISLADSWMPATNPRIVSLNTNIRMAADAPIPVKIVEGDSLIRMLINNITPTENKITCTIWTKPFSGLSLNLSFL